MSSLSKVVPREAGVESFQETKIPEHTELIQVDLLGPMGGIPFHGERGGRFTENGAVHWTCPNPLIPLDLAARVARCPLNST